MKRLAWFGCVVTAGLLACATGSTVTDGEDGGSTGFISGAAEDASNPVVVVGGGGSSSPGTGAGGTGTTGGGTTGGGTTSGGYDAGGGVNTGGSYDAGLGGYDAGGTATYDAGSSGGSTTCQGYASPATAAGCTCAATDPSQCQPNGCYGGYYCDTVTSKCHKTLPSGC